MPVEIQVGSPHALAGPKPTSNAQWLEETWRQLKAADSSEAKETLVTYYMSSFVPGLARNLQSRLPHQIEVDDLIQQGYLGLIESISRFDLDRGIRFETFSARRITGAMQDYLRALDPVPRLTRTRAKRVRGAEDRFLTEHGRRPDDRELRQEMDLDPKDYRQHVNDARPAAMVSLHGLESNGEHDPLLNVAEGNQRFSGGTSARITDLGWSTPLGRAARQDLRQWIVRRLSKSDQLIIVLYYYEQMTMRDVGQAIGCSESRISQRLDSILCRLRSELLGTAAEFEFLFDSY